MLQIRQNERKSCLFFIWVKKIFFYVIETLNRLPYVPKFIKTRNIKFVLDKWMCLKNINYHFLSLICNWNCLFIIINCHYQLYYMHSNVLHNYDYESCIINMFTRIYLFIQIYQISSKNYLKHWYFMKMVTNNK